MCSSVAYAKLKNKKKAFSPAYHAILLLFS